MSEPWNRKTILGEYERPLDFNEAILYYSHSFYCDNCGKDNTRYILKGVRAKGLSTICSNCGCEISSSR